MPASRAASTTCLVPSRSSRPPKLLQPRPTTETTRSEFPTLRSSIVRTLPAPVGSVDAMEASLASLAGRVIAIAGAGGNLGPTVVRRLAPAGAVLELARRGGGGA